MNRESNRIAAATAAVAEYLAAERREKQRPEEPLIVSEAWAAGGAPRGVAGSLWAVQGRSDIMQVRGLMQWRAFRRA